MWTSDEDDDEDDVQDFLDEIEGMLTDSKYEFARETLEGISETVEETQRVTDRQRTAVENIREGGNRRSSRDRGRW